jgi:hypothetical protein
VAQKGRLDCQKDNNSNIILGHGQWGSEAKVKSFCRSIGPKLDVIAAIAATSEKSEAQLY